LVTDQSFSSFILAFALFGKFQGNFDLVLGFVAHVRWPNSMYSFVRKLGGAKKSKEAKTALFHPLNPTSNDNDR